ncbi:PhnD/SsuA/transferrin family substrate-binding protein [Hoeflea sp. CAU 1731]
MSGGDPIAALPMYDWPELQSSNDRFWRAIRVNLAEYGIAAPERLERTLSETEIWNAPGLVIGQTCGLPYVLGLKNKVQLLGAPAYDIACGAGSYYSVIVVHADCPATRLDDLANLRFAYNNAFSQSGFSAFGHTLRKHGRGAETVAEQVCTGSHRASIRSVADGKADIASIDAVSWRLAQRHEPAARMVKVIEKTDPTPGLPYICARDRRLSADRIHNAVVEAMAGLDEETRDDLLLTGFSPMRPKDYAVIESRYRAQPLSQLTTA